MSDSTREANASQRGGGLAGGVCVIIAAKDAAATIGRAVRSALAEPEVRRVVVVDDGSRDATGELARREGAGTDRVTVLRLEQNRGPAYARNLAIQSSDEPFIAILDADDAFLPGRFERLAQFKGAWDLLADDIAFVADPEVVLPERSIGEPFYLGLAAFVAGNLARAGVDRGEYGFLKPVLRRETLLRSGCLYNPALRLGEDYDLYARLLARGARFAVVRSCGYRALVRADSLSGRHRTVDLQQLVEVDAALLRDPNLPQAARSALLVHLRQTRAKFELRRFLDTRRQQGLAAACRQLGLSGPAWAAVAGGIVRDKLATGQPPREPVRQGVRYLL
ncbi:glycosyltransferase family 2 protein [Devosia sp. 919]|uniref:glycosyltransferase family 2 protein n=1 Tax=Devosia sp. 919 TaxID=2726065 RepID=UPI0032C0D8EA